MNICMIAPGRFPLPGSGSVEICIWATARQLARRHNVTVISREAPGLPGREVLEGVRLIRLPADTSRLYLAETLKTVKEEPYELVQVDNRPHLMAAVKRAVPHVPVVLFLHSLTFVPGNPKVAGSLGLADLIAVNSLSLGSRLARIFPGDRLPLAVVPLGADLSRFTPLPEAERRQLRLEYGLPRRFTVLFVGRIIPRKGLPVLMRAVAILGRRLPVHLVIAGTGKPGYVRSLKKLARRLRLSVSFMGGIPHEDIHRIYQIADCLVCPSQRHESFGLVNVEAMASGLPVIASNNGGIREIILSGRNGYLVDRYRESASFARRMLALARSPERAFSIGMQGRRDAIQAFDWGRTADRLELLYSWLCKHQEKN
ncbi:glycosyltransferase family 4 protein [Paenibacillus sp. URB8-2]|uniref:glycosyltransferase family 4 protein n=1 Tax=Paenibacillus sp. URB8-2 TaxID=2741301 RepID=UPI0015BDF24B|nr:glycosyltransferase family 4 protein [Paenibacillus sp. URB8-2]BCG56886.1 spore coat protein SA [Paenibacillus sp. URB8-2]